MSVAITTTQTITTEAQFDALPAGALILALDGSIFERDFETDGAKDLHAQCWTGTAEIVREYAPLTVVWLPASASA